MKNYRSTYQELKQFLAVRYQRLSPYHKVVFSLSLFLIIVNLLLILLTQTAYEPIFGLSGLIGLITIILLFMNRGRRR